MYLLESIELNCLLLIFMSLEGQETVIKQLKVQNQNKNELQIETQRETIQQIIMQHNQQKSKNNQVHKYLEIRQTKSMGLGYFTKQHIPARSILIRVPKQCFITYEAIIQHVFYKDILEDIEDKRLAMAFYMASIEQISEDSQFCDLKVKEYLKNIPKKFDILICWSINELDYLECQSLKQQIVEFKKKLKKEYEQIQQIISQHPILKPNPMWVIKKQETDEKQTKILNSQATKPSSLDQDEGSQNSWCSEESDHGAYDSCVRKQRDNIRSGQSSQRKQQDVYEQKAPKVNFDRVINLYAAIISRNFHYFTQIDQQSKVGAIVPSMEYINHKKQSCCQISQKGNNLYIIATRDILKDEQIFLNYGKFSLEKNLKKYGFVDTKEVPQQSGRKSIAQLYKKEKRVWKMFENLNK